MRDSPREREGVKNEMRICPITRKPCIDHDPAFGNNEEDMPDEKCAWSDDECECMVKQALSGMFFIEEAFYQHDGVNRLLVDADVNVSGEITNYNA